MQKLICCAIILLLLNGCSQTHQINIKNRSINIAPNVEFYLLSPADLGESLVLTQSVEIFFAGEQYELLFYTEVSVEKITIVGLMPNGARLFSIVYDGEKIESEGYNAILDNIKPESFLADFQLSQWPVEALHEVLEQANPCFNNGQCSFEELDDQLSRRLTLSEEKIIEIHYSATPHYLGTVDFQHKTRGYRLKISTVNVEFL